MQLHNLVKNLTLHDLPYPAIPPDQRRARHALYGGGQRGTPQPATSRLLPPAAGRGKPAKVALTAVMRKLLTILNAMLKHHTIWSTPCPV